MLEVISRYFTEDWQTIMLLSVMCVSLSTGALSPLVVANRMAFFSDAVAHSTLAGVALGLVLGIHPVATMVGFGVIVALIIATLRRRSGLALDTLLGVAMAASLAVGVIIYHHHKGYTGLHSYLFGGHVSFLDSLDLAVLGGTMLLTLAVVFLFSNQMTLLAVSRPLAQARGVPVGRYDYLLIVLLGLVVSVSVRAVGLLLINALLVVPAATSKNLSRSFAGMFWGSMIVSVLAGLCGLIGGDYFGFPPAPSIVAAVVVLFVLSQFGRLWVRQPALES